MLCSNASINSNRDCISNIKIGLFSHSEIIWQAKMNVSLEQFDEFVNFLNFISKLLMLIMYHPILTF